MYEPTATSKQYYLVSASPLHCRQHGQVSIAGAKLCHSKQAPRKRASSKQASKQALYLGQESRQLALVDGVSRSSGEGGEGVRSVVEGFVGVDCGALAGCVVLVLENRVEQGLVDVLCHACHKQQDFSNGLL